MRGLIAHRFWLLLALVFFLLIGRLPNALFGLERVSANSARSTKIRELASYLKTLAADEIGIAVHYLSGEIPQGRIGIGYSTLRAAASRPPAEAGTLTLIELDHALTAIRYARASRIRRPRATRRAECFGRRAAARAGEGRGRIRRRLDCRAVVRARLGGRRHRLVREFSFSHRGRKAAR